jgi:hypothetical protein
MICGNVLRQIALMPVVKMPVNEHPALPSQTAEGVVFEQCTGPAVKDSR